MIRYNLTTVNQNVAGFAGRLLGDPFGSEHRCVGYGKVIVSSVQQIIVSQIPIDMQISPDSAPIGIEHHRSFGSQHLQEFRLLLVYNGDEMNIVPIQAHV